MSLVCVICWLWCWRANSEQMEGMKENNITPTSLGSLVFLMKTCVYVCCHFLPLPGCKPLYCLTIMKGEARKGFFYEGKKGVRMSRMKEEKKNMKNMQHPCHMLLLCWPPLSKTWLQQTDMRHAAAGSWQDEMKEEKTAGGQTGHETGRTSPAGCLERLLPPGERKANRNKGQAGGGQADGREKGRQAGRQKAPLYL